MPRLLPRMPLEPPAGYVAFVATHLDTLREDAVRAMGDEVDGDHLYPEVLSDIALRWSWLELRRTLLRQATVADRYLSQALVRRVRRLESERIWGGEDEMWLGEIEVWNSDRYRPLWSSAAVRLAPYLRPAGVRVEVGPLAEASIAWWHAYEARRRHRMVAVLVLTVLLLVLLMRVHLGTE